MGDELMICGEIVLCTTVNPKYFFIFQNFASFMEMDRNNCEDGETSLISLGCKVVQIRRDSFFYLINSRNLYLAKEIAEVSR